MLRGVHAFYAQVESSLALLHSLKALASMRRDAGLVLYLSFLAPDDSTWVSRNDQILGAAKVQTTLC